ncbi:MAG: ADP-ribosylglycohydrolase family protein, partial [Candidatus Omnitrophica bacterium]|nr:ADP-ribosylglycohydrolase family protein [Candidatus Omnitrophota bacterium]
MVRKKEEKISGSRISLQERLTGCLAGAAIGAELGWSRSVRPEQFFLSCPDDFFTLSFDRVCHYQPEKNRMGPASPVAMIDAGIKAYLKTGGRATPEDFASVIQEHQGISAPTIFWDTIHTVQEILKEGMPARLAGTLVCPTGFLCACMPAVAAYHFGNPDYAYLDGVELASVAQSRIAADWAGLAAAAIATCFDPEMSGPAVLERILQIAFSHQPDLFYELDWVLRPLRGKEEKELMTYLFHRKHEPEPGVKSVWLAYNPIRFVLPAVSAFLDQPEKMLRLTILSSDWMQVAAYSGVIAGAMAGARNGLWAFPTAWLDWAQELIKPWQPFISVVEKRLSREKRILVTMKDLKGKKAPGGTLLEEKIKGCLLAGAIGNAMGSPVEGKFWWEIEEKYPGGITTILDPSRLEGEDDNQMAMLLVETYLRVNGRPVMARDFGKTWLEKLNRDHFYIWCMGHAYDRLREGWDPRIIGHWSVVTGSTVMCLEPVGIYHLADPEFAAIDALAIAYMYQRGLDALAASLMAATVAEALKPEATVESICQTALQLAPEKPLLTFDRRPFTSTRQYLTTCLEIADRYTDVLAVRKELYDRCLFYHMIDPLEVWGLSLAMFKISRGDVRQAAIGGTNIGRDSDTIAGRAAMLAGALSGASNVPKEWVAMFPPASLQKIDQRTKQLVDLLAG